MKAPSKKTTTKSTAKEKKAKIRLKNAITKSGTVKKLYPTKDNDIVKTVAEAPLGSLRVQKTTTSIAMTNKLKPIQNVDLYVSTTDINKVWKQNEEAIDKKPLKPDFTMADKKWIDKIDGSKLTAKDLD